MENNYTFVLGKRFKIHIFWSTIKLLSHIVSKFTLQCGIFHTLFITFLIRIKAFLPQKQAHYPSPLPHKILHRYSIVTPSIVHRNDGAAIEQRWTSDGAAAKEKRNQSGGKAGSSLMFSKVLHDER